MNADNTVIPKDKTVYADSLGAVMIFPHDKYSNLFAKEKV